MPGCVIDATPIAVDFWRPTKAPQAHLFFLTHLHADHIEGLTSTWRLPIYTSPITARLLKKKLKLPDSVVRELEVGQSFLIPLDEESNSTITVTVLDANHVPGAVMFLFQGYFGNILYCGDMRWDPKMLEDQVLQDVVQQRELDILYLDNTYSAPYCQFPPREDAMKQIVEIIDMYPDHEIKIGIHNLGREELLEDIALKCGERILVSQDIYEQLELLGCLDAFTTDPKQSRIHAVPIKQMQVASHKKWNEKYQTISIIPTALFVGWKNGPYSSQASDGMHVIPYSNHSSYSELIEMVSQLAPHQVIPIVKYWSKSGWWDDPTAPNQNIKADMTVYRHLLSLPPPDPIIIPEDVIKIMDSKVSRLLHAQPRRCVLRRGLSPRRRKYKGVIYSSPGSHSLPSVSQTPSGTPASYTTSKISRADLHSPRRADYMESPKMVKHGLKFTSYNTTSNMEFLSETAANEVDCGHTPNDMHMEINTRAYLSDLHITDRLLFENQPANNASSTIASVSKKNYTDGKKQPRKHIGSSAKRALFMESPEKTPIDEEDINMNKKMKSQRELFIKRDTLLRETIDFIACKNREMNSYRGCSTYDELRSMVKDTKLILESISCLDSLL